MKIEILFTELHQNHEIAPDLLRTRYLKISIKIVFSLNKRHAFYESPSWSSTPQWSNTLVCPNGKKTEIQFFVLVFEGKN